LGDFIGFIINMRRRGSSNKGRDERLRERRRKG
jgi:hypothetical protein